MPDPTEISPEKEQDSPSKGLYKLFIFCGLVVAGILVSTLTPLRQILTVENIQQFSQTVGWWGPAVLFLYGLLGPLLFLPRWPVCFLGGLLYGILTGSVLANFATAAGAFLHYLTSHYLVSPSSSRLLQRLKINPDKLTPERLFWLIFMLRVFPLSNSAATNVLAGALRMKKSSYLLSTFWGMIPSTILYAAWGRLMRKPDPKYYFFAVALLILLSAGTFVVRKRLFTGNQKAG